MAREYLQDIDLNGNYVVNVGEPLQDGDAANKQYVDQLAGGASNRFDYKADTNDTSGLPPSRYLLWDNATQTSASNLHLNVITDDGIDATYFLGLIISGDVLFIFDSTDHANYQEWDVSGDTTLVDAGGGDFYYIVPVTLADSGGDGTTGFSNAQRIIVTEIGSGAISNHLTDTTDAHDASAISYNTTDNVQNALHNIHVLHWMGVE